MTRAFPRRPYSSAADAADEMEAAPSDGAASPADTDCVSAAQPVAVSSLATATDDPLSVTEETGMAPPHGSAPTFTRVRVLHDRHEHAGRRCSLGEHLTLPVDAARRLVLAGHAEYA